MGADVTPAGFRPTGAAPARRPAPVCAVSLIDRRTGRLHRINGTPLVLYTRQPDVALSELMEGRDPSHWHARIEPLGQEPMR